MKETKISTEFRSSVSVSGTCFRAFRKELESSSGTHWYLFDDQGYMLTGKQIRDGKKYYLEDEPGPDEGALWKTDESGAQHIWTLE